MSKPTRVQTVQLPAFDSQRALDMFLRMVAIPGKSGQEAGVVEFITRELVAAGLPASSISIDDANHRSSIGGDTGSLIVKLPGTKRGLRRLLMAHMDTVPLCVGCQPVLKGKTVRSADPTTALGGDDRAGACVVLIATLEILRQGLPHPPLTLFWPIQEEIGLYGARLVRTAELGNPKLCFNWDGSSAHTACIGATGAYDLNIEIDGIASHAGVHPEGGVSAIAIASLAVADLHQNGWHGLIVKGRHTGTSNIGIISGGNATNVVTSHVTLRAEVRSHDPRFRNRLVDEFRRAFERAVKAVKNDSGKTGKLRFKAELKYESFRLDEATPSVQESLRAIRAVGLQPETRISNGGLDANWLSARGLPTVTLGCGQQSVHTVDETLNVDDYLHACQIGLLLATDS
ncbi:MAG: M20/M25/M40 family metallo-hydrolase [Planctomycetales bacterium]|nr:M20/M25/M40 family metallo-hydrolase [Planctomycetales bacterium]